MRVYRLEKDGVGPFSYRNTWLPDLDWSGSKASEPKDKEVRFKRGDNISQFYYGCTSLKQLKKYFGNALNSLLERGYEIKEYIVRKSAVRFGRAEVAVHVQQFPHLCNETVYERLRRRNDS